MAKGQFGDHGTKEKTVVANIVGAPHPIHAVLEHTLTDCLR